MAKPILVDFKKFLQLVPLSIQSGDSNWKHFIPNSSTFTYIHNILDSLHGQHLSAQELQLHAEIQEKIKKVKLAAIQAGFEVTDHNSLDEELQQAHELSLKIKKREAAFEETCSSIIRSESSINERRANLLKAAIAFYGKEENLPMDFKMIKIQPKRYRTLDLDPQGPNPVKLSEEFKEALVELGVAPQKLLNILLEKYRAKVQHLREIVSPRTDGEAIQRVLNYFETLSYFQGLALSHVSERVEKKMVIGVSAEDVYSYWAMYSAKFLEEFFSPLASAKELQDIFKFLTLRTNSPRNDLPPSFSTQNYALLDEWATVDASKTSPSLRATIPSLASRLLGIFSLSSRVEKLAKLFDPRNALASEDVIEKPWILGTAGQLGIKLFKPISPAYFVILSPPTPHEINPTAGVKDIEVWGHSTDGRHILLSSFTRPKVSSGYEYIKVNEFSGEKVYFNFFQLVIKSNHGHPEYTKLYQFAAYGLPAAV